MDGLGNWSFHFGFRPIFRGEMLVDEDGYVSLISTSQPSRMGGEEFNWAYATLQVKVKACAAIGRNGPYYGLDGNQKFRALTKTSWGVEVGSLSHDLQGFFLHPRWPMIFAGFYSFLGGCLGLLNLQQYGLFCVFFQKQGLSSITNICTLWKMM